SLIDKYKFLLRFFVKISLKTIESDKRLRESFIKTYLKMFEGVICSVFFCKKRIFDYNVRNN
ncbi:hypothetical protein ACJBV5_10480, partial [Streptococcus suis]